MDKKLVAPGDCIGTEEEYLPGAGTFIDKEKIYSTLSGDLVDNAKTLSVAQKRPLAAFGIGTIIVGVIENVVEPIALVSMQEGSGHQRFGGNPDYAVLHASMIKRGYVKNVSDEYKIGDIIRAKIADMRNGEMRLSTDSDNLGAIKAFCSKCRHGMALNGAVLECESCGRKENRKVANDYRKAEI
ncbi:MAG: exosome complex RNA-binding protein Csl4 [Candidatus Micrarchaeota archaeon]|nr:exosome complex RNA-binding protein Csl4 [Candidatus Micrarchaeota archaeon]